MRNPLRQDLWRAGHAHAGVWLILALVALRYVDEARYGFFDFDGVHVSGIRLSFFLGFRPEAIFHLFSHNQR
jgi:drug/metabolite transporter superfamily protein YnfA